MRSYSFALLYLQNFYRVSEGISKILLAGGPEQKNAQQFFSFSLLLSFYRASQGIAGIILAGGPEKNAQLFVCFPLLLNFYRDSQGNSRILIAGGPEKKKRAAIILLSFTSKISIGSLREFLAFV